MPASPDPKWPPATSLVGLGGAQRTTVGLVGVPTYATSVTPKSARSTPAALREALARYSTWATSDGRDLAELVNVVDAGDVLDPDGEGGLQRTRALCATLPACDLTVVLGGDNAATWLALGALAGERIGEFGLVTLDAHLDFREGRSNGSPVRQLVEAGLVGARVCQVGLADFSNSAPYAADARAAGVHAMARARFDDERPEDLAREALALAGAHGGPVYVDIDLDVADRAAVPGCPGSAPGGLSAAEVRRFVREVAASPQVVALDVTEIDVDRDAPDGRTVRLGALVVLEAIAAVTRRAA
ncbi:MAG: arginase family protein [Acidimicrobiales bacterium]